jgi:hypothetical protein
VSADAVVKVGDKEVGARDVLLACVAHKVPTGTNFRKEVSKDDDGKKKTGTVDTRDLDRLSKNSKAPLVPGSVEVATRARELVASGVAVDKAYLQAEREFSEGGDG